MIEAMIEAGPDESFFVANDEQRAASFNLRAMLPPYVVNPTLAWASRSLGMVTLASGIGFQLFSGGEDSLAGLTKGGFAVVLGWLIRDIIRTRPLNTKASSDAEVAREALRAKMAADVAGRLAEVTAETFKQERESHLLITAELREDLRYHRERADANEKIIKLSETLRHKIRNLLSNANMQIGMFAMILDQHSLPHTEKLEIIEKLDEYIRVFDEACQEIMDDRVKEHRKTHTQPIELPPKL